MNLVILDGMRCSGQRNTASVMLCAQGPHLIFVSPAHVATVQAAFCVQGRSFLKYGVTVRPLRGIPTEI